MSRFLFTSLHRSGIPWLAARLLPRRHFVVLNFHRVRDEPSDFHDGVIEVGSRQFREHLEWLGRRVRFVGESDVLSLRPGGRLPLLLTFDDGYKEASEVIAPILEELGIPAIFFLAPGMLDRRVLGSWDRIAWLVKKFPGQDFRFRGRTFSKSGGTRDLYLELGRWSQDALPDQGDEFVTDLARALQLELPGPEVQGRELITWDDARQLQRRGFRIGCHAYSHRVLSSLPLDEQEREIRLARDRLRSEGCEGTSFAYPFGEPQTFSWETRELALKAGYKLVFAFSGRIPRLDRLDPSCLDRVAFKSTVAKYDFLVSFPGLHNLAQRLRSDEERSEH